MCQFCIQAIHVRAGVDGTWPVESLSGLIEWRNICNMAYYPLSYRVPVRERYGSTLLPATREQHDQNCTQSH